MTLRKLTTKLELETSEFVDGVEQSKRKTIELSNTTSQSVDAIKEQYSKLGKVSKTYENKLGTQEAAARKMRNEMNRAERAMQRLGHEYDYAAKMAGKSSNEQEILKAQMKLGAGATDEQRAAIAKLVSHSQKLQAVANANATAKAEEEARMAALRAETERTEKAFNQLSQEYQQANQLVGKSAQDQEVLKAQMKLGANATDEQRQAITRLVQKNQQLTAQANKKSQAQADEIAKSRAAAQANAKVEKTIENLAHEYAYAQKMMSATADEQEVLRAQMLLGTGATDKQRERVAQLVRENQNLTKASGNTTKSFRNMRGIASNLGFQLQDVAVQAQAGTNWLVILGQQGSQALGAFGAWGAAAGAVLAIAAAMGSALAPALMDTKSAADKSADALENLNQIIDTSSKSGTELTDNIGALVQRFEFLQESIDKVSVAAQMDANKAKVKELSEAFEEVEEQFTTGFDTKFVSDVNSSLGGATETTRKFSKEGQAVKDAFVALQKEVTGENIEAAARALEGLSDITGENAKEMQAFKQSYSLMLAELSEGQQKLDNLKKDGTKPGGGNDVTDEIKKLEDQAAAYGKTEAEQTRLKLGYDNLSDAQQARIDKAIEEMANVDAAIEKSKKMAEQLEDEAKARKKVNDSIANLEKENELLAANADEQTRIKLGYDNLAPAQQARIDKAIEEKNAILDALESAKQFNAEMEKEAQLKTSLNEKGEKRVVSLVNELNALNGMPPVEEAWLQSLKSSNQGLYDQIKAIEALVQKKNADIQVSQAERETTMLQIQATKDSFGAMRQAAEEGSMLQKAAIIGEQAMAASQVWMNAEAAKMKVTAALAGIDTTGALTAARVGVIEGQKWASLGAIAANTVAGVFHDGGGIPDDGTYLMQGGEYVESRAERRDVDEVLNAVKNGGTGGTLNLTIHHTVKAIDTSDFEGALMKSSNTIAAAVEKVLHRRGQSRI